MKKLILKFIILIAITINLFAQHDRKGEINLQLDELSRYGVQYKFLDETTIELINTLTGLKQIKTIKEPETEAIYNWANQRGIPILEIDPTQVDTTKWTGWYDYWSWVRIGNPVKIPTPVKDFDDNGFPEVYGPFGYIPNPENRVFEVYPDGSFNERYNYSTQPPSYCTHIVDSDNNRLLEIVFQHGTNSYFYEQPDTTKLPIELKFVFNKYDGLAAYLSIERMTYMDKDTLTDFVHRGADTSIVNGYMLCVSEYNPLIQNFERVWFIQPPNNEFDGYDVGDYDGDRLMEIIASSLWGKVWVIENTGDNNYELMFQDSLPLINMFQNGSGDIDNDGKREFFVGATMGNGNWTTMFETDGDNSYSPKFIFHLLSGGSLDDPTYITNDVDGDDKLEFAILSGGYLYIFKSDGDDSYYLWYLKQGPASWSINFYDMDGDSIKDILWTVEKDVQCTSNIYKGSPVVSVEDDETEIPDQLELLQNYPNPFNPSTVITYQLPVTSSVSLKIYDVLGNELNTLVKEEKRPGEYKIEFDASHLSSGVYFYRLQTETGSITKKMLLIR